MLVVRWVHGSMGGSSNYGEEMALAGRQHPNFIIRAKGAKP